MRSITIFCLLSAVCAVALGQAGEQQRPRGSRLGRINRIFNRPTNELQEQRLPLTSRLSQSNNRNQQQQGGQQIPQQGRPGGNRLGQLRGILSGPGIEPQQQRL